jgi:hypothetical protein
MIEFAFRLRIVFARWFKELPIALPPVAPPLRIEAAPAAPASPVPVRRVPRMPRGTFIVRGVGNWDSPPADLRPYIHPTAPEGGLLAESRSRR